ncbi:MAG TPA: HEPN domain-containing protein [Candidatus Thermoplasmatota archaeon]|nr:HEPN domain-containing protein [Candidatus Thermoplasmatota archaeon]
MRDYLAAAVLAAEDARVAPAHNLAIHALELGLKAAILAAEGALARRHNPGGEFGRLYRDAVDAARLRRVNRILNRYNDGRYPGGDIPLAEEVEADLAFIASFLDGPPAGPRRPRPARPLTLLCFGDLG